MRKGLILLLIVFPVFLQAQHLNYNQYELVSKEQLKASAGNLDNQYEDIKGSAYFSPLWLTATAVTAKGNRYADLKVKYDIYKNIFFANVHDTLYDLSSAGVVRFILYPNGADTTVGYTFQKGFVAPSLHTDQFVLVLASGKLTFLKQLALEVKEVNDDSPLDKVKKFIGQDYYYVVTGEGQGTIVKLNKKTLETATADKWNDVLKYAKDKNLSFSDEQGWSKLIQFYNGL